MPTGALNHFPIVHQKTKRWLYALQKYGPRSRALSRSTDPRHNTKVSPVGNFSDPALANIRFHRCRQSKTPVSRDERDFVMNRSGPPELQVLKVKLSPQRSRIWIERIDEPAGLSLSDASPHLLLKHHQRFR